METTEAHNADRAILDAPVHTVLEFCEVHRISRSLFYLLVKDGKGPRLLRCRGRTLVTREAAEAWRRKMEEQTADEGTAA